MLNDFHAKRFWGKVNKNAVCWLWTGKPDKKGYGRFCHDRTIEFAHRVSYQLAKGNIPLGMFVLHHCDTPACVNPAHLFLGTLADNNADMRQKGRGCNPPVGKNKGTFESEKIRGERHPRARLSWEDIVEIRRLSGEGVAKDILAIQYKMSPNYIRRIVKGYQRTTS